MCLINSCHVDRIVQQRQFRVSSLVIIMRDEHEIIRLRKDSCILNDTNNLYLQRDPTSSAAGTCMHRQGVSHLFVILIYQILIYDYLVIFQQAGNGPIRGRLKRRRSYYREGCWIYCLQGKGLCYRSSQPRRSISTDRRCITCDSAVALEVSEEAQVTRFERSLRSYRDIATICIADIAGKRAIDHLPH